MGASARAAAGSARRAGFTPWCVDLFADRDLAAVATVKRCSFDDYPQALPELLHDAPPGAEVLLTGAMENHLDVVERIAMLRPLRGLSVAQMRALRDPGNWPAIPRTGRDLVKRSSGAGGRGVRFHTPGQTLQDQEYLQPFVEGTPISAVVHAHHGEATVLGVTRQIIGDARFGAQGFVYCGSVGPLPVPDSLRRIASDLARRHALHGLLGIDAVLAPDGQAWAVEVNPRYTASVEVVERAEDLHALSPAPAPGAAAPRCCGKAYVMARGHAQVGDLYEHLSTNEVADVPAPGSVVSPGSPICTVLAQAPTLHAVERRLQALAETVYTRSLHERCAAHDAPAQR